MKLKTKFICISVLVVIFLSGLIALAIFDDDTGPNIYQVDIVPASPKPGDSVIVVIYCIDPSGVSGANLQYSKNDGEWEVQAMYFLFCLCIAGGRWVGHLGVIADGDVFRFYVTAFDNSANQNPTDTQIFEISTTG